MVGPYLETYHDILCIRWAWIPISISFGLLVFWSSDFIIENYLLAAAVLIRLFGGGDPLDNTDRNLIAV